MELFILVITIATIVYIFRDILKAKPKEKKVATVEELLNVLKVKLFEYENIEPKPKIDIQKERQAILDIIEKPHSTEEIYYQLERKIGYEVPPRRINAQIVYLIKNGMAESLRQNQSNTKFYRKVKKKNENHTQESEL